MINRRLLKKLAEEHGTPLFVVDHDQLRRNYAQFKRTCPASRPTTPSRPTPTRPS